MKDATFSSARLLELYDRISDAEDAVPRLRSFVLDLAVRGKLVEQDAGEEPAAELLTRITQEKEKLGIKRRPDVDDVTELPFILPRGWALSSIGEVCSKTGSGSTPRGGKEVYTDNGVPFLRSQNIYDDGLRLDDVALISIEIHERMSGTAVKPGDLLLNITGGSMGRCCRILDDFDEANVSQHVAIIRPAIPGMSDFLHRLVLSPYFQVFIFGEQTGAGRGGLPKNRMDRIAVALPPLAEQHRIVAKVDELMALCHQLEQARAGCEAVRDRLTTASLARLTAPDTDAEAFQSHARFALQSLPTLTTRPDQIKTLRQTILNLAVRGRLVAQNAADEIVNIPDQEIRRQADGKLGLDLPENWQWASVSEVADARLGKMLDKAKNRGKPYPYLGNTNVHWFDIRAENLKEILLTEAEARTYLLKPGDVLICEGGHGIGRSAVWRGHSGEVAFQKALHRVRPSSCLNSDFFAICSSVYFDEGVMQTYFTGVGILHFTGRALARLLFPLPPLAEQNRIVAKVDALMALCDQLEASLTTTATTRSKLLNALLHEALDLAAETADA